MILLDPHRLPEPLKKIPNTLLYTPTSPPLFSSYAFDEIIQWRFGPALKTFAPKKCVPTKMYYCLPLLSSVRCIDKVVRWLDDSLYAIAYTQRIGSIAHKHTPCTKTLGGFEFRWTTGLSVNYYLQPNALGRVTKPTHQTKRRSQGRKNSYKFSTIYVSPPPQTVIVRERC